MQHAVCGRTGDRPIPEQRFDAREQDAFRNRRRYDVVGSGLEAHPFVLLLQLRQLDEHRNVGMTTDVATKFEQARFRQRCNHQFRELASYLLLDVSRFQYVDDVEPSAHECVAEIRTEKWVGHHGENRLLHGLALPPI